MEDIIGKINELGLPVIYTGDGFPVYAEKVSSLTQTDFTEALPFQNRQNAAALGTLAVRYLKEGKMVTADAHVPDYMRLSQAERERAEKEKSQC